MVHASVRDDNPRASARTILCLKQLIVHYDISEVKHWHCIIRNVGKVMFFFKGLLLFFTFTLITTKQLDSMSSELHR